MRTRHSTDRLSTAGYSVESVVLHNCPGILYFESVKEHTYSGYLGKLRYIPAFPLVSYIIADIRGTRSSGTAGLVRNPLEHDADEAVLPSFETAADADEVNVTTSDTSGRDRSSWLKDWDA